MTGVQTCALPISKDPFDRAINGIIEICNSANIQINANDIILKGDYKIKFEPAYKLSKFIDLKELEHIKFANLKNQITIKTTL